MTMHVEHAIFRAFALSSAWQVSCEVAEDYLILFPTKSHHQSQYGGDLYQEKTSDSGQGDET